MQDWYEKRTSNLSPVIGWTLLSFFIRWFVVSLLVYCFTTNFKLSAPGGSRPKCKHPFHVVFLSSPYWSKLVILSLPFPLVLLRFSQQLFSTISFESLVYPLQCFPQNCRYPDYEVTTLKKWKALWALLYFTETYNLASWIASFKVPWILSWVCLTYALHIIIVL